LTKIQFWNWNKPIGRENNKKFKKHGAGGKGHGEGMDEVEDGKWKKISYF
jgi:hypothetical protein